MKEWGRKNRSSQPKLTNHFWKMDKNLFFPILLTFVEFIKFQHFPFTLHRHSTIPYFSYLFRFQHVLNTLLLKTVSLNNFWLVFVSLYLAHYHCLLIRRLYIVLFMLNISLLTMTHLTCAFVITQRCIFFFRYFVMSLRVNSLCELYHHQLDDARLLQSITIGWC